MLNHTSDPDRTGFATSEDTPETETPHQYEPINTTGGTTDMTKASIYPNKYSAGERHLFHLDEEFANRNSNQ
jgi:hypothetical protein